MLREVILPTQFLNSEFRKVQLEAKDIPLHASIFGMSISIRWLKINAPTLTVFEDT